MGFGEIPTIENYKFFLDVAFKAARIKASSKRKDIQGDKINRIKILEFMKMETVESVLRAKLEKIVQVYPNFDDLTEFYTQLVKTTMVYSELKKSLGAMNWAQKKISEFTRQYKEKIRKCGEIDAIKNYSKQYFGRIASVLKQISKNLMYLEEGRRIMRDFPSIKEGLFTIAITGFPNIGKTTLLSKITDSKPEINSYAFTTKTLNMGYMKHNNQKIQFIDTPGSLNRLDKMNYIEQMAYLAIKYCAHAMIYVYDLTEPFPLKDQKKLLLELKSFDKPIILYLSKTDILPKEVVSEFTNKVKAITDIEVLKEKILEEFKNY
ncbi:MAG: GTPase [archaeon]